MRVDPQGASQARFDVQRLPWVLGTGAPGGLGPSLASWAQGGMQGDEGWQLAEAAGTCS